MTVDEANAHLHALIQQRSEIHDRIVKAARPILAVLLDAGRQHSAAALQELFFELDAKDGELHKFVAENQDNILTYLRGRT